MKVKGFAKENLLSLELAVNEWIKSQRAIEIINMNFSTMFYDFTPRGYRGAEYSCLILYNDLL